MISNALTVVGGDAAHVDLCSGFPSAWFEKI